MGHWSVILIKFLPAEYFFFLLKVHIFYIVFSNFVPQRLRRDSGLCTDGSEVSKDFVGSLEVPPL